MAHVSHRLSNSFQGALAGGGDPASSPLYVFGPFLQLIVLAGVADVTFGASIWLVVFTVVMVSAMYRLVMRWVVDGSGGSGLSEEEFGPWAVKVNASITFVEYTLTFLVSIAALVTFASDRLPALNGAVAGVPIRTALAIGVSAAIGWLVNRGPRTAARAFGPATLGVLLLLWTMIGATIWRRGLVLPSLDLRAFAPPYLGFTLGGFARILALMTGIEIFANLVAAYAGPSRRRSNAAFGSLIIIMGTTCVTMLVVGPAILALADPSDPHVSVFTQAMDQLLPPPLPWVGTLIGVLVLGSAAAASAQGLQNLALGLRLRHYLPAWLGMRNRFDVADMPVWVEVAVVTICFMLFGTREDTYLALYAAGVFVLLSMTGWAASKRLLRQLRKAVSPAGVATLSGTVVAATLTTVATAIIFAERFADGAWTYAVLLPALVMLFGRFRARLGPPRPLDEHLGKLFAGQYRLPFQRHALADEDFAVQRVLVPLDGSPSAEHALTMAEVLARSPMGQVHLLSVMSEQGDRGEPVSERQSSTRSYLDRLALTLHERGIAAASSIRSGRVAEEIGLEAAAVAADAIVMTIPDRSPVNVLFARNSATKLIRETELPVVVLPPVDQVASYSPRFARLLVCLDGSEGAEEALPWARVMARRFGSTVVLLSVPEAETEMLRLEAYLNSVAQALRNEGLVVDTRITGSGAAGTITRFAAAENCDLIVVATRGRGAPTEIGAEVGSVTGRIIETAPCPVFVVTVVGLSAGRQTAIPLGQSERR